MAVPFYLPEGGADDAPSSSNGSSSASSPASEGAASTSSQSPNTTSSATQTPMQSPLLPGEQLVMAIFEAFQRYSVNNAAPVFQYPSPPSPTCPAASPSYNGGEVFFPRGRSTPRTSVSFTAGEEVNYYRQSATTAQLITPQSAPPIHHNCQQPSHHHHPITFAAHYAQYTPPPTPTTLSASSASNALGTASSSANNVVFNGSNTPIVTTASAQTTMRLYRSHSDAARRSRLTSTGEDEREYQSEYDTSIDEYDDRFDNFTAGRDRLQEFNGRIPPRKKKNKDTVSKQKSEKKEQSFTWPTMVTVFVVAMGCGFLVAR